MIITANTRYFGSNGTATFEGMELFRQLQAELAAALALIAAQAIIIADHEARLDAGGL